MMQRNGTTTAGRRYQPDIGRSIRFVKSVMQKVKQYHPYWFIIKFQFLREEPTGWKTCRLCAVAVMEKSTQAVETDGTDCHPRGYANLYIIAAGGTGAGSFA